MPAPPADGKEPPRLVVHTPEGGEASYSLHEFHLSVGGQEWTVLHAGMMLTRDDETRYLREMRETQKKIPFGLTLWSAGVALAYEIAARAGAGEFSGKTVLELGAGTGLPGIIAAALGNAERVVQTDHDPAVIALCRRNASHSSNAAAARVEQILVDWADWPVRSRDEGRGAVSSPPASSLVPHPSSLSYDWIIGSDILYAEPMHSHLLRIFQQSLAPGGRILISDPFRAVSVRLLESLQDEQGWKVAVTRWNLGDEDDPRAVGVFELSR